MFVEEGHRDASPAFTICWGLAMFLFALGAKVTIPEQHQRVAGTAVAACFVLCGVGGLVLGIQDAVRTC